MAGTRVGVIADTHGLLRPQAVDALRGCSRILHGGDVGSPELLEGLARIAPVVAVRGNVDRGAWAEKLPLTEVVEIESALLYLVHDIADLDLDPATAGFAAVVSGHSHRPRATVSRGILYLNPGSAGPRRFSLPVSLATLTVSGSEISHQILELNV